MDEPEAAGSESGSSALNRQTPAPSVGSIIKTEPSFETDVQEVTTDTASQTESPPPPPITPTLSPAPSQLPQATLSHKPKTDRRSAESSTAVDNDTSSNAQANELTPVRVTRQSSRERTLRTSSTPTTPTTPLSAKMVTITASKDSVALNQNRSTPNSAKRPKSSVKRQRRKSIAQEPPTPARSFQCKHCAYTTTWKCNFVRHLLIHNDSSIDLEHFQCEECAHLTKPSDTNLPPSKQQRAKATETENAPFSCNSCAKKFTAKDLLDMHYTTVHRHQCSKCKKKFANGLQADAHSKRCK